MVNTSIAKKHSIKKLKEPIQNNNKVPLPQDSCSQTRNKARITIELDYCDAQIIFAIATHIEKDFQTWIRRTLVKAAEEEWLRHSPSKSFQSTVECIT